MRKTRHFIALLLALVFVLTACGNSGQEPANSDSQKESEAQSQAPSEKADKKPAGEQTIVLGVSPKPHAEIAEVVVPLLAKEGIKLELKTFDDYVIPNKALASGDIDANYFQHLPYLEEFAKDNKLSLASIGGVHIEPLAIYSAKYKSLKELPDGAKIIIPNDVTNGARALLLLEKEGYIKLDDPTNLKATEMNITENPHNFTFIPMEAPSIPRQYEGVDAAAINSNYAIDSGLNPVKDGLVIEDKENPYANIIAVRQGEENEEKFQKLLKAFQSEEVKKFIEERYQGAVIPAF